MKATSELEKILDIRYIHGIIAYLKRRREVMFIFLKCLFVNTTEVKYRCNLSKMVAFASLCIIYIIVSCGKDPFWSLQRPYKVREKCQGGMGFPLNFTTITYHVYQLEFLCLPSLLQQQCPLLIVGIERFQGYNSIQRSPSQRIVILENTTGFKR